MLVGPYCVAPEPHHCYSALAERNPGTPTLLGRPLGHSPRPRHPTHRSKSPLHPTQIRGASVHRKLATTSTGRRPLLAYGFHFAFSLSAPMPPTGLTDTQGSHPPEGCYDVHRTSPAPRSTLRCHFRLTLRTLICCSVRATGQGLFQPVTHPCLTLCAAAARHMKRAKNMPVSTITQRANTTLNLCNLKAA